MKVLKEISFSKDDEYKFMKSANTVFGRLFVGRLGTEWQWYVEIGSSGDKGFKTEEAAVRAAVEWYEQALKPFIVSEAK